LSFLSAFTVLLLPNPDVSPFKEPFRNTSLAVRYEKSKPRLLVEGGTDNSRQVYIFNGLAMEAIEPTAEDGEFLRRMFR
jgi:hypothetical protein